MKRLREQEDINNTFNENNDMTQNMDVYSLPDEIWLEIFKNAFNKNHRVYLYEIELNLPYEPRVLSRTFCSMIDSNVSKVTLTENLIETWQKNVKKSKINEFWSLVSKFLHLKNLCMKRMPSIPKKFEYFFDNVHWSGWSGVCLSLEVMNCDKYKSNKQLVALLKRNHALNSLEILDITSDESQTDILFCLQLATALKENNILTSLTITGLYKTAKYILAKALKQNTSLIHMRVNQRINEYYFKPDGSPVIGTEMNLNYRPEVFKEEKLTRIKEIIKFSKCLKNNTTLKELSIIGIQIDKDTLDNIDPVTKFKYTEAIEHLIKKPNFKLNI